MKYEIHIEKTVSPIGKNMFRGMNDYFRSKERVFQKNFTCPTSLYAFHKSIKL